ncbi:GDSL-type esterase/lipase family protein [Streptomyces sp. ODS05-4]|uniref:GDSL-type esterase/lipase family protein n=1 Tax=Streptomyces sp. ODS05-4 TaxID=2944939 RepID=UPI00210CA5BF|nr:GDSL-type esterase/lipase family protein [Streptomyces sp. ODS05-4]
MDDWLAPEPFLRGTSWFDGDGRPVRADPGDLARLPWDTAARAEVPTGVRLEFTASPGVRAVALRYRAAVPGPRERTRELPHCFGLWQDGAEVCEVLADPVEEAEVTVPLPSPRSSRPFTVYPPESRAPRFTGIRAVGGRIAPAPGRPRWLVHGDSITEGWLATRPAHAWPAAAGRILGLDPVNLGYAGSARGDLALAQQLGRLPAPALTTLAFGTNCWSGVPCSAALLYETVRTFVALVRAGHPDTPLLVVSPLLRPEAEHTANPAGATLAALRAAMEEAARDTAAAGDGRLALLPGRGVLGPEHLADGLHPNDAGHARLARAVAAAVRGAWPGLAAGPRPSGRHARADCG